MLDAVDRGAVTLMDVCNATAPMTTSIITSTLNQWIGAHRVRSAHRARRWLPPSLGATAVRRPAGALIHILSADGDGSALFHRVRTVSHPTPHPDAAAGTDGSVARSVARLHWLYWLQCGMFAAHSLVMMRPLRFVALVHALQRFAWIPGVAPLLEELGPVTLPLHRIFGAPPNGINVPGDQCTV